MKNLDRSLKVLLALLVIGVWGLLIRSIFTAVSPSAQAQARKQYAVIASDKNDKLIIGGAGTLALSGTGLQIALEEIPRQGWRLHSVVSPQAGGYVVIVER